VVLPFAPVLFGPTSRVRVASTVKLPKRLDVARAADRWSAQLPALIEQQLRSE
jgi:hypothetical protein